MFGFIRPVKAELRVKEADRFQQVYCGLCHAIRAEYGRFYTLFLSYDMTFFALVAGSEEAETAPPCRKRCDASPFRRKSCAETDDALRLAADASILLTYHKFQDDLADEKGAKRALAALLCRLGRRGYEKARARMPEADEDIRQALEDLRRLEAERCPSMDRAADTSSRMTETLASVFCTRCSTRSAGGSTLSMRYRTSKRIWKRTATIRSFCGTSCKRRTSLR